VPSVTVGGNLHQIEVFSEPFFIHVTSSEPRAGIHSSHPRLYPASLMVDLFEESGESDKLNPRHGRPD
jgi:hypothetical protein